MDKAMSAALMADFPPEQIGYKPVSWCKKCSEAVKNRQGRSCGEHRPSFCQKCRTTVTEAHSCLDFVGHADVRARLCEVDPEWTWEPFEFPGAGSLVTANGHPVGLWIKLTVGGVTKPGYGSCDAGKNEAMKELIGDALRNAGQSFGIAWKLWAKGDRSEKTEREGDEAAAQSAKGAPANGGGRAVQAAKRDKPGERNGASVDRDAQAYADEASQARTVAALKAIYDRAAGDKAKALLGARVADPATGTAGNLTAYFNLRKRQLEETDAALRDLTKAAGTMAQAELERHVKKTTGASIESATTEQLRQAAQALAGAA